MFIKIKKISKNQRKFKKISLKSYNNFPEYNIKSEILLENAELFIFYF